MLKRLLIENVESHKKTEFNFSPGLNIFIGDTNAGKSGSFRAIYWTLFNKPNGDWMFPLFWKGISTVTMEFTDPDTIVQRIKSASKNHYQLNDLTPVNSGAGDPPQEIQDALMIGPVNFQTQLDRAYLMFETSGERGRILNKMAGFDDIDRAIKNSNRDRTHIKSTLDAKLEELKAKKEQLAEFEDLDDLEQKMEECERVEQQFIRSSNLCNTFKNNIELLENIDRQLDKIPDLSSIQIDIDHISIQLKNIQEAESIINKYENIIEEYDRIEKQLQNLPDIEDAKIKLEEMEKFISEYSDICRDVDKIEQVLQDYNKNELEIKDRISELADIEKQMPKLCPTCGRKTDGEITQINRQKLYGI